MLVYNSVFRPLTDIETPPVITAAFSLNILYLHIEKPGNAAISGFFCLSFNADGGT